MARHEIVIHENTSATSDAAPYLASYISKENVTIEQCAEAVGAKCGQPAIQVYAILHGVFEVIKDVETDALVRIHTDLGVICGVLTGSFRSADAVFDPLVNSVELALLLDDEIKLCLANASPTIVFDGEVTKLRVDNLMDLEVNSPMNLIHGQHVFRVAGYNMVLDDEGAGVLLVDKNGTEHEVVVDEVISKQLFKAHTAELLPAGDYKLVVKSRAGDAAGQLQTSTRKVSYLRVVNPPTITSAKSNGLEEGTINAYGGTIDVVGENLEPATAIELHTGAEPGGEGSLWQTLPATYADGKLTADLPSTGSAAPSETGFVRVVTAGGSATYPVTYTSA